MDNSHRSACTGQAQCGLQSPLGVNCTTAAAVFLHRVIRAPHAVLPCLRVSQNDIWSLGIVVAECLLGEHPLGAAAAACGAIMPAILSSQPLPLSHLPVSAACKDWLAAALSKDPRQRWSAARLLQHEWIAAAAPPPKAAAAPPAAAASKLAAGRAAGRPLSGDEERCVGPAVQLKQHPSALPPWVDDDWVGGVNSLLAKAELTPCRRQEQQQPTATTSLVQHCHTQGITSWED